MQIFQKRFSEFSGWKVAIEATLIDQTCTWELSADSEEELDRLVAEKVARIGACARSIAQSAALYEEGAIA